jgi:hypothetical protein
MRALTQTITPAFLQNIPHIDNQTNALPLPGEQATVALIDFDRGINDVVEEVRAEEAHRARHKEEPHADDTHVAKVQHVGDGHVTLQLCEVPDAVREHIQCGGAGDNE